METVPEAGVGPVASQSPAQLLARPRPRRPAQPALPAPPGRRPVTQPPPRAPGSQDQSLGRRGRRRRTAAQGPQPGIRSAGSGNRSLRPRAQRHRPAACPPLHAARAHPPPHRPPLHPAAAPGPRPAPQNTGPARSSRGLAPPPPAPPPRQPIEAAEGRDATAVVRPSWPMRKRAGPGGGAPGALSRSGPCENGGSECKAKFFCKPSAKAGRGGLRRRPPPGRAQSPRTPSPERLGPMLGGPSARSRPPAPAPSASPVQPSAGA